jgi:TPR repeat protein
MGLYDRLALYANGAGVALSATGALAFCLCALNWLFGIWNFWWADAALVISFCSFFLGGVIGLITEAPVEEATRRRHEVTFADQLHRAQWGNLDSMLYIGSVYLWESPPGTVDMRKSPPPASAQNKLDEAEFWFKRATDKRYPRAFYYLARLYWKQRNYEAMKIALEEGIEAGDAPSMSLLGRLHLSGKLYGKDLAKGTALVQAAAAKGNVVAKAAIGRLLLGNRKGSMIWVRGVCIVVASIMAALQIAVTKGWGDERLP